MMAWAGKKHLIRQTDNNVRIRLLSVVFILAGIAMVVRLFDLQVVKGEFYDTLASGQHELFKKLFPERGSIYVSEKNNGSQVLYPLVSNKTMYVVFVDPKQVENATTTAEKLVEVLGLPEDDERAYAEYQVSSSTSSSTTSASVVFTDPKKNELIVKWRDAISKSTKSYYPLRERVEAKVIDRLKELDMPGVGWSEKSYRFYPEQGVGGQVFGFWGYQGDERKGKYGLEGYFDDLLTGQAGEIKSERDARGNMISLSGGEVKEKVDGADLVLTINRAIQFTACEALKKSVTGHGAASGSVIVMDPSTGAILAMCSVPDYNPDKYYEVEDASVFNNKAIFDSYEPGSVFKVITMAGAIDAGKVTPDTTYTDTGSLNYGQYNIRNYEDKTYGFSTMTKVLEYSINTGVIFAMKQMGPNNFVDYVKKFGFGENTGVELQKEFSGNIKNLNSKSEINKATATFGQGITVTPIQLATAFSAVVNGGKLMKPYVVSQVLRNNEVIKATQPQVVRQVISPKSSLTMKAMMVSVVDSHVKSAQIDGYRIGGKTGTAQVPNPAGSYYPDDVVIGSFAGFVPFNNPKIVILVRVDRPQSNRTGEGVAVPVFNEIAKFALQYYNIPHDK
jgi:cell division protein FtsI/penicillin-binding protein 2